MLGWSYGDQNPVRQGLLQKHLENIMLERSDGDKDPIHQGSSQKHFCITSGLASHSLRQMRKNWCAHQVVARSSSSL